LCTVADEAGAYNGLRAKAPLANTLNEVSQRKGNSMKLSQLLLAAFLSVALPAIAAESRVEDVAARASLQAAMQTYIDRVLVDDAFLDLSPQTGTIRKLHPATAHPVIMRMGKYFILCADFRDAEGRSVPVDFYLGRRDKGYAVFHAEVGNRGLIERLAGEGKVSRFD
jgi:hypothetical protein